MPSDLSWDTCTRDDCIGARLRGGDRCWAHADQQAVEAALQRLAAGQPLDARGVPITKELLERFLAAAPRDDDHPVLDARFDEATFENDAVLGRKFRDRGPILGPTIFQEESQFDGVTFRGEAVFDDVIFHSRMSFDRATFHGGASFTLAEVGFEGRFRQATFKGPVTFALTRFEQGADFEEAIFETARQLGPLVVIGRLNLDGITCHQAIRIVAAADHVTAERARFTAGTQLLFLWAHVSLDDAEFTDPSILDTAKGRGSPPDEEEHVDSWRRLWGIRSGPDTVEPAKWAQPRLLSLRRADVAGLTIADVDLRECQFAGAHHLDQLRFDGEPRFATAPGSLRWTRRLTLAEEHTWRYVHGAAAWSPETLRPPNLVDFNPPEPRPAAEVAALYRALRKGREDSKDAPGAADFYYGEMEMRRHARRQEFRQAWRQREFGPWAASVTEHAILTLYWLVSGYGLRAWRALVSLLMMILLATAGFAFWGFAAPDEPSRPVRIDPAGNLVYTQQPAERPAGIDEIPAAIQLSVESATAFLRSPDQPLTYLGWGLHLAMRLLGPVLLGLTVLSIRARVKR